MTEETNPKVADLAEVLSGRTFPKAEVPVFFDEEAQYRLNILNRALIVDPSNEEVEAKRDELLESLKAQKFVVHMKGAPRRQKREVFVSVQKDFPPEVDFLGRQKENAEADEVYANKMLALHIEKVVWPDGRVSPGSWEVAALLRNEAPEPAIIALQEALKELDAGSKGGYESVVQDLDF